MGGPGTVGVQLTATDCGRGPRYGGPTGSDGWPWGSGHDGRQPGAPGGPAVGIPAIDFSAPEPNVEFVPPPARVPVGRAVEGSTPAFIINCRSRLVHRPAAHEDATERADWQARCGWSYGVRQFFRRHAAGTEALPALLPRRSTSTSPSRSTHHPAPRFRPAGGRQTPIKGGRTPLRHSRRRRSFVRGGRQPSAESRGTCRRPPPPW